MKKAIALLLSVLMLTTLFGCAAKTTTTPAAEASGAEQTSLPFEGVSLTFGVLPSVDEATDMAFWKDLMAKFKEETGADVEVQWSAHETYITTTLANLSAGAGPDVFVVTGGNEQTFVNNGFLQPLDGLFDEAQTSTWIHYDAKTVNGVHYVVPRSGGASFRVIFVNEDILNELGLEIPSTDAMTWDLLLTYGKQAVDAGYKGFVTPFSGNANTAMCNYVSYLYQAGGSILDENGDYNLDSSESVEAFQFIDDMFNKYGIIDTVSYSDDATFAEFKEGNTLFACFPTYMVDDAFFDELGFQATAYHLRGKTWGTSNAIDNYAINSSTENLDASVALLSFLLREDNWSAFNQTLCSGTSIILNSIDNSGAFPEEISHLTEDCTNFWEFPSKEAISDAVELMATHQQLVAMGDETPEAAAEALQAAVEALLE